MRPENSVGIEDLCAFTLCPSNRIRGPRHYAPIHYKSLGLALEQKQGGVSHSIKTYDLRRTFTSNYSCYDTCPRRFVTHGKCTTGGAEDTQMGAG